MDISLMDKITSLAKRRGFIFPGSDIYGGLANAWDYGPMGVEMKNNIKARWWQMFVHERSDMYGLDAALLMNTKVWQASGHLAEFSDPLMECKYCHARFRADELGNIDLCPTCQKGQLSDPKQFNLMLKTFLGPVESDENIVYFRPETAQGIFVNFKNVVDTMRPKLPFGIAQVGKAFRNEITPGNFIFRTREFEQMEIEYFFTEPNKPEDWQVHFETWRLAMHDWIKALGIKENEIVEYDVPKDELAHYSEKTIDFEYKFPFGQKELFGLAYRGNFDLRMHKLDYTNDQGVKVIPHVIEPSLGVDRSFLAAMLSAYCEETVGDPSASSGPAGIRVVLKLPVWLAPIKVAVFPLMKNKPELVAKAVEVFDMLRKDFVCDFDDNGNVGKRYRRQDEIGTPFCVTIDFDSLEKGTVTVRDRDTMAQEVILIDELRSYLMGKM